jgi:hypothetical protein
MTGENNPLEDVLYHLEAAADGARSVSLRMALESVGRRSFGPLILLAGLITLAPLVGDIPGAPTIVGILVFLSAGQLLAGRQYFWLPDFIMRQTVSHDTLVNVVRVLRKPSRFLDGKFHHRLAWLTGPKGTRAAAAVCLLIALSMPAMEMVPFSANGAGAALCLIGLGLMAHDGVYVFLSLLITLATFSIVLYAVAA